jgi:alkyl hydroperoxide reductase subunit AhpC
LGDLAPDFSANTTQGPLRFHEWMREHWVVLFSHPHDFTPVCTTELAELARLKPEFDARRTKLLGLSVDTLSSHEAWSHDVYDISGEPLRFPLVADTRAQVAELYDMIHPREHERWPVRALYVIDPQARIRLIEIYPFSTGRNFTEVLRALDSMQLAERYKVVTPADWTPGEDVIISPALQDENEIKRLFPQGYRRFKSYLRVTPDPRTPKKE